MVFACLQCAARFRVDDARLAGKVLRFTCPKCGQVHLLRDPATHARPVEAASPSIAGSQPSGPARHPTISEVRLTQSAPTLGPSPVGRATTQTSAPRAVPTAKPPEAESWFAIRRGQRIGPFTRSQLLEALRDGTLHERSFLWRPTMEAWTRLNQIPELKDVLDALVGSRPPSPAPVSAPVPPPLPQESTPEAPPPLPAHRESPRARTEPVDTLFSDISRPAIDLRKAYEVQPEEPEIPDAPPPRPPVATERPVVESAPPASSEVSPTGLATSSAEKRFFTRAFVLPQAEWPAAPSAEPEPAPEPARKGPSKEPQPRLRDFSVMFRLTRRSRRRTLAIFGSLGLVVVAVIGLVLYWSFSAGPAELGIALKEEGSGPTFRQTLYTVPRKERQDDSVSEGPSKPQQKRRTISRPSGNAASSAARTAIPEATLAKAPEVDPALDAEFQRYAGILSSGNGARTEAVVDVKPRTLTEMPKHRFDESGMDAFLASKMKKFADCKARMRRKTDLPVKVVLGFTVGLDGKVHDIVVEQAAGPRDDALDDCIRRVVSGWAFPPPEEEATVRTTLLL